MNTNEPINYIEFAAKDIEKTKQFFSKVFNWTFQDYGADYTAFSNSGVLGGFYRANLRAKSNKGSALIVLYRDNLEGTLARVEAADGVVVQEIFSFPGGRRFHFEEPSGNELAVWSDK